jgi:D-3-phosphoglycerate dehydrogenase / 2-oxoglutarate reductase
VTKPVVLIAEELSPATLDALGPDFEVRHVDGADRGALLPALAGVDAVLIRSATKMDAEAIAAAKTLKVIARAGVGLDNVDVETATKAGVMVVNAPTSNITSAAELAVGLLLACARNIAPANEALRNGAWKRSKYGGVELLEKKVGIVGFGRIGQLVAERLKGFGVEILAYDPYVSVQRAGLLGARLVTLDELLAESDFITIHLPKTPETIGLIGKEALTKVKPTVRVINAARGGVLDEEALADAIAEGRVAGAGLDVFATEPCTDSPLFAHESVVVTPHLGASTEEAQEKAGVAVAKSVRLALGGDLVPDAVNVAGGAVAEEVRPGIDLVEKLGRVFTAFAGAVPVQLDVEVSEDFRNVTTLHGTLADGTTVSVAGTLTGPKMVQKLIGINGYDLEIPISTHMAFFAYEDRPGVIGAVGKLLGEADVNIAGMQVSRDADAANSLIALTVDQAIPLDVVTAIEAEIGAETVRVVDLV